MAFAATLRGDRGSQERTIEEGVPFFVPQLSKVKTTVMCQTTNQHLLFCFEKPGDKTGSSSTTASDGSGSSYRKQGNQDLYSEENLRKRQRLLEDKQVLAAITRFWDTFPHIRMGHTILEKRDYVDVFLKFFKALVAPSEFSMAEAKKIVERDWERDVGDAEIMTRPLFYRALFEVADIWTVGIGPEIYTSFLKKLFDRVTMTVFDQDKSMWLTVFADLDKIRPFAEPKADREPHAATSAVASPTSVSVTTNQDVDTGSVSGSVTNAAASSGVGAASGSVPKSKPPLLKKKMLSVPNGLGSPTKSNPFSMLPAAEAMGGSMRRLPDLQTVAVPSSVQSQHGIVNRGPRSPRAAEPSISSRSEGSASSYLVAETPEITPLTRKSTAAPAAPVAVASSPTTSVAKSGSPVRTIQKSSIVRREANGAATNSNKRRDDKSESEDDVAGPHAAPTPQEIPPQQVRFTMPSIYLSPEITPSNGAEVAARRRIRESMKLAQRLRRITF